MNKNDLILKHFHKVDKLSLTDKMYQKLVKDLITWLLESDQVTQDTTSKLLFEQEKNS